MPDRGQGRKGRIHLSRSPSAGRISGHEHRSADTSVSVNPMEERSDESVIKSTVRMDDLSCLIGGEIVALSKGVDHFPMVPRGSFIRLRRNAARVWDTGLFLI